MNHEQIEGFAAVLREIPTLTELEIRHEGATLRLRRLPRTPAPLPRLPSSPQTVSTEKTVIITAQHVGTFQSLGDKSLMQGSSVKVGQLLGRLDTMRLLSDCSATVNGSLQATLVEDGQPVEYGQPLFEILPEGS